MIKNLLNPEGHQNPISGSKGVDLAYWWSFIRKGLRLQPAQQAGFKDNVHQFFLMNSFPSLPTTFLNAIPTESENVCTAVGH